jgi:phosphomannomutase/phosphoglucomutase
LHAIFPQCFFSVLHGTVEPDFAGRSPECARASALGELCDAVYRERAHLGIAFDGDGDCLALVDDQGVALSPEESAWVVLECLGEQLRGQRFVYDLKFSDRIPEAARRLGAEPLAERSGHAFLHARMQAADALLGADLSGHYFHRALDGGDDALYTACLLVAYLSRTGTTLSQRRATCPAVYMTPDLRLPAAANEQREVLDRVGAAWNRFPQRALDGVRIDMPGGWALVRRSVTEPALTFRFEGLDWLALEDVVKRFREGLPQETGDLLWQEYRTAMGLEVEEA